MTPTQPTPEEIRKAKHIIKTNWKLEACSLSEEVRISFSKAIVTLQVALGQQGFQEFVASLRESKN